MEKSPSLIEPETFTWNYTKPGRRTGVQCATPPLLLTVTSPSFGLSLVIAIAHSIFPGISCHCIMVVAANADNSGIGYTLYVQVTVVVWAIVLKEYLVLFVSNQSNPLTAVSTTSEDADPLCLLINSALESRIVLPPAADRAEPATDPAVP